MLGPKVIIFFIPCMKFILLINFKMLTIMPTIVGILTFISRINDWRLCLEHENSINSGYC